jgi:hypothetical protein
MIASDRIPAANSLQGGRRPHMGGLPSGSALARGPRVNSAGHDSWGVMDADCVEIEIGPLGGGAPLTP